MAKDDLRREARLRGRGKMEARENNPPSAGMNRTGAVVPKTSASVGVEKAQNKGEGGDSQERCLRGKTNDGRQEYEIVRGGGNKKKGGGKETKKILTRKLIKKPVTTQERETPFEKMQEPGFNGDLLKIVVGKQEKKKLGGLKNPRER